jgi:hypothetical protein
VSKKKWIETEVELCLLESKRTVPAIKHAEVDGLVYHQLQPGQQLDSDDTKIELPRAGDTCRITHVASGKSVGLDTVGPMAARKALLACASITDWSVDEKAIMDAFQADHGLREKLADIRTELRESGKLW